jgi:hypothetical protein
MEKTDSLEGTDRFLSGVRANYLLRCVGSMRFHPKRRASTDHSPGPNIASAAASVATMRQTNRSADMMTSLQLSMTATSVPTIGVKSPMSRKTAAAANRTDRTVMWKSGLFCRAELAILTKANPTTSRIKIRPIPGQPPAKVEYKRRNGRTLSYTHFIFVYLRRGQSPTMRLDRASFEAKA